MNGLRGVPRSRGVVNKDTRPLPTLDRRTRLSPMAQPVRFTATIRHWREDPPGGLAVIDIPTEFVAALGGRRQRHVEGTINGARFGGSTMLVAGGGFAVGVSKAAMTAAKTSVGSTVDVALEP